MVPVAADELHRLLGGFNRQHGANFSLVLTRTGTSIAHEGSIAFPVESLAALSATLMNAAEVIYTGLGHPHPWRVLVDSDGSSLVVCRVGAKSMFVALGGDREKILRGLDEIAATLGSIFAAKP